MSIMNEKKFGRILETGMGFIMSWVLNTSAMYLLGISCLGGGLCYCGSH